MTLEEVIYKKEPTPVTQFVTQAIQKPDPAPVLKQLFIRMI
jgi:hypothetical protein